MLKDIEIYERVLAVSAKDDNKIAMYPTLFTDPCILPLRDNKQKEITFKNNLSEVTIYSPKGLPHGHYARQIIAYLTTLVRQNESDEIVISRSISSLFNECTGKRMGGHNQVIFESTLEKVLELTIHRKHYSKKGNSEFDIRKSALISEYSLTRRKNGKKIEISFKPSTSFRSLIIQKGEAHPIDLRALHFFRSNDRVLANDLYIFLSRKAVYLKNRSTLLKWATIKLIFPNAQCNRDYFFKEKVKEALKLIELIYPDINVKIIESKGLMIYKSPPHIPWKL